jgi:hypothetical protein
MMSCILCHQKRGASLGDTGFDEDGIQWMKISPIISGARWCIGDVEVASVKDDMAATSTGLL